MSSEEFWERMFRHNSRYYGSVEELRDAIDPGWRQRERAKQLAAKTAGSPARQLASSLGRVGGREYRQVNVKLGAPDFEALKSLALIRDLAPATLARVLLRNAIRDVADGSRKL